MNDNECCKNCKFYAELKISQRYVKPIERNNIISGFSIGKKGSLFEKTHCCLMFVKTENEPYVLEIGPFDMCEMFTERKDV